MKIRFCKSRWEMGQAPFEAYAARVAADGFEGAEVFLLMEQEDEEEIRRALAVHGLFLVAQVITQGGTPEEHRRSLVAQLERAAACGARLVNAHTGSDFFAFQDNVELFKAGAEHAGRLGLKLVQETHRGRALYNLPDTLRYLEALPELRLTADISHFMCVHESELRGQGVMLAEVARRCDHVHARVGFPEGPQVGHPLAPEWAGLLEHYLEFWKLVVNERRAAGAAELTVTPEAGPPPYMPVLPFTGQPVADAWTVNREMKAWLQGRLV